jgi:hypothetical protein
MSSSSVSAAASEAAVARRHVRSHLVAPGSAPVIASTDRKDMSTNRILLEDVIFVDDLGDNDLDMLPLSYLTGWADSSGCTVGCSSAPLYPVPLEVCLSQLNSKR